MFTFFSKNWSPDGLHCYVTGGSSGLGLALAILLTQKGAHVSIVARDQGRLDEALAQLEAARVQPGQILKAHSVSLTNATDSAKALRIACQDHQGLAPDAVFACAGAAKPRFFVEHTEEELTQGMFDGYWVQAWTAHAAAKLMVKQHRKGKIVLVSSTLGLMSFVGWSSYSPAKHALRALGETLHSELMLYDIGVHTFFPPTMVTRSYEEEMKTKPRITKEIEEDDKGLTPEQAALALFKGVERGQVLITGELMTDLFRASARGSAPKNNWLIDGILDLVAYIAVPIWRSTVDKKVLNHREEHEKYLEANGFFL